MHDLTDIDEMAGTDDMFEFDDDDDYGDDQYGGDENDSDRKRGKQAADKASGANGHVVDSTKGAASDASLPEDAQSSDEPDAGTGHETRAKSA